MVRFYYVRNTKNIYQNECDGRKYVYTAEVSLNSLLTNWHFFRSQFAFDGEVNKEVIDISGYVLMA